MLPLTEASRYLAHGEPFPVNAVVLTVDDGHRDFYTGAYPVFPTPLWFAGQPSM